MQRYERSSGVLLHISSLPNPYGIGSLGSEAYEFIELLKNMKQKLWQICPLGPTGYGDSPYQCFSAFAGNPYFISLETLAEKELLTENELPAAGDRSSDIDYGQLYESRFKILLLAFNRFKESASKEEEKAFKKFCEREAYWLKDYTLFMALKNEFKGRPWQEWDRPVRLRESAVLNEYRTQLRETIEFYQWMQYQFFEQFEALKSFANLHGVQIVGDMPIYVAADSADAWANPDIFLFDSERKPVKVAGVPPDYFSVTGQLWGNPLYNWDRLQETKFKWWIERCQAALQLFDYIRIDHFRGFASFWAVPYGESTAIQGEWLPAKGQELFTEIRNQLGVLPILAEDLGVITPDVEQLRDDFKFPGMKILQFAFDSDEPAVNFLPHMYPFASVVYTGTHDNQTLLGWYQAAKEQDRAFARSYLKGEDRTIAHDFIRAAIASTAVFSIFPMQDLLYCGDEARMNTPSVAQGNWRWRFDFNSLTQGMKSFLTEMTTLYGRS